MSNETELRVLAQLGDANPIDHGGYWVYQDPTGEQVETGEILEVPEGDERKYVIYRFDLTRCTYVDGVLSDNAFHPSHAAWFAKPKDERNPHSRSDIDMMASFVGMDSDELIALFCSENPVERAEAYRVLGSCHGYENLDSYPLRLTRKEVKARYKDAEGT